MAASKGYRGGPAPYAATSAYASCPAATGEARGTNPCPHYPDTAHRCCESREHPADGTAHHCTCDYRWAILPVSAIPPEPERD